MIDTTQYTKTHELYTQFGQWLGVDGKIDSNYFMINYSLHAAEAYIKNYYNIDLSLNTVFEKVSKHSVFAPSHKPTKIINVFKSGKLVYPVIEYLDSNTFSIVKSSGDYSLDMDFNDRYAEFYSTYLTGYVYTDTSDYSNIDFDDEYRLPNPKVFLDNNIAVQSPQTVYTNPISVTIVGVPYSKVFIDSVEVGVIDKNGTYIHNLELPQEVTTLKVKIQDPNDENIESTEIKELFILSNKKEVPYLHLVGYTRRVNTDKAIINVIAPIGSNLTINNESTNTTTSVTTTSLVTKVEIPIATSSDGSNIAVSITADINGVSSREVKALINYDTSLSNEYIHELNKDLDYVPYLPDDLMIAVFKLANHFYNGTLYNNANTDSFRLATDISQSYTSHTIPSDVKRLLSVYTHYTI